MLQALLLAGVVALSACVEGYPTEDAALLDESAMSVPQLVATLNAIGAKPQLGTLYRYAMAEGCVLHVTAGGRDASEAAALPLAGADIQLRTVDGEGDWQVLLHVAGTDGAAPVLLLQGGRWADAVQVRSLVQHLQRRCALDGALAFARR